MAPLATPTMLITTTPLPLIARHLSIDNTINVVFGLIASGLGVMTVILTWGILRSSRGTITTERGPEAQDRSDGSKYRSDELQDESEQSSVSTYRPLLTKENFSPSPRYRYRTSANRGKSQRLRTGIWLWE
jgi:hypothetical protein